MRVGIEVGGTFTDLVAVQGDQIVVAKVPSTPKSPDIGAFAALAAAGLSLPEITDLAHGSTVATNAVLERKGARVAFVATSGLPRHAVPAAPRPAQHLRALLSQASAAGAPRGLLRGGGADHADGSVDRALDEEEVAISADPGAEGRAAIARSRSACSMPTPTRPTSGGWPH